MNNCTDDYTVLSLIVDGIEYVPIPQNPANNLIAIGAYTWNTRLADFINSLSIPNFYAEYPSEADLDAVDAIDYPTTEDPRPRNTIRLVCPTDVEFTLESSSNCIAAIHELTKSNSLLKTLMGVPFVDADSEFYLFHRFGCQIV